MSTAETFAFQTETTQLMELMIHSLYTNKDIFLRELISNASDALDRLRFEALTHPDMLADDDSLEIRLESDKQARTLSIHDTGIGMSRDEIVTNIGTIAKSGTRALLDQIKAEGKTDQLVGELIGRFGVGFYSAFMVADKVTLVTRRADDKTAIQWESTGNGQYTLAPAEKAQRGTSITLHLKAVDPDGGIEDYSESWVLSRIVKQYSDFVAYPIKHKETREEVERDDKGLPKPDTPPTIVVEDKTLNSMTPLWTRSQSQVTDEEYGEFYKHISHDWEVPLKHMAFRAEGRFEFQGLVFIPAQAPGDLYHQTAPYGLQLYAQRIMIMEYCEDLLPRYLRFLKGVVDSSDLPLNISRQRLQQDRHITQIRTWLVRRVLDTLSTMQKDDHETYLTFWQQFGRTLKEGVGADYDNKDTLVALLLFPSSNDAQALTSLKDYVARMPEAQSEIYYLTGESRHVVENSPHLEAFKAKGYEVLYLVEPVDELVVQGLTEFEAKQLQSVGKGTVQLGSEGEKEAAEQALKEQTETFSSLLELLQQKLDAHVKEVRLSTRLTQSPVCLVGAEHDYSPQLERLLRQGQFDTPQQHRIMELNPSHTILAKLQERFA
ncbi:MAG: molecular chaperone HtpG, partial [bacterium]|nr:molecular chaperone HtpG [bacterium]